MPNIITLANSGLSRQALRLQAEKQQIVRLYRGAYINAQEYAALDTAGQYRARARAFLATHPKLKPWGITAAALEGAPVLSGALLHFAGSRNNAKSKYSGCVIHEELPVVPAVNSPVAQMLFECAVASPLPDALIAGNYLLRELSLKAGGSLMASRDIDEHTTEAVLWDPLNSKTARIKVNDTPIANKFDLNDPGFLETYSAARTALYNELASPEAELAWLDFVQLCLAYKERHAMRRTLRAGLYLSDQAESPAESFLVARCVELGFEIPLLQVNILHPMSGLFLGRVDGMWPSEATLKGLYKSDSKFGRQLFCKQPGDNDSVIVEFDGKDKYRENYADVLEKERQRQNAISNLGFRFVRISWEDIMQPDRLRTILITARIPKAGRGRTKHKRTSWNNRLELTG